MTRAASSSSNDFIADFHLPPRYEITRAVGRGSFGTLVAARDAVSGRTGAIKKVEGGSGALGTDRQRWGLGAALVLGGAGRATSSVYSITCF